MCGGEHGHGGHGGYRGRGYRGFGRRGFPSREQWLERLQAYQLRLEDELKNVQDVIERLGGADAPQQTGMV